MPHLLEVVSAGLLALAGAALIVLALAGRTRLPLPAGPLSAASTAVFLFEGEELVDATAAARRLLRGRSRGASDLSRLLGLLSRGFGADLGPRIAALPAAGRLSLASGAGVLEAEEGGGTLRITLRPGEEGEPELDGLALEDAQEELILLRGIAEGAPQPIWALDAAGALVWANGAYLALADLVRATAGEGRGPAAQAALRATWPAASIFEPPEDLIEGEVRRQRRPLALPGREEPLWFDLASLRRGAGTLHFATDVGELVLAESARLHFVQALARTFADLATGLAVFDRQRRLVLFNPAFVDLTGLPVDFLSGRPLVQAVLDRLREVRVLPEPRSYASWREELAALEAAAAKGDYADAWTLPGGRTYRVTGRPHPDGALAFLFEDITDGIGLASRLRAERDAAQGAFEALETAAAAFGTDGRLDLSNAAYAELWGPPPASPGEGDLARERARWDRACAPSPLWSSLPKGGGGLPDALEGDLHHRDGRTLRLRAAPLPRGGLLVTFRAMPPLQVLTGRADAPPRLQVAERAQPEPLGAEAASPPARRRGARKAAPSRG